MQDLTIGWRTARYEVLGTPVSLAIITTIILFGISTYPFWLTALIWVALMGLFLLMGKSRLTHAPDRTVRDSLYSFGDTVQIVESVLVAKQIPFEKVSEPTRNREIIRFVLDAVDLFVVDRKIEGSSRIQIYISPITIETALLVRSLQNKINVALLPNGRLRRQPVSAPPNSVKKPQDIGQSSIEGRPSRQQKTSKPRGTVKPKAVPLQRSSALSARDLSRWQKSRYRLSKIEVYCVLFVPLAAIVNGWGAGEVVEALLIALIAMTLAILGFGYYFATHAGRVTRVYSVAYQQAILVTDLLLEDKALPFEKKSYSRRAIGASKVDYLFGGWKIRVAESRIVKSDIVRTRISIWPESEMAEPMLRSFQREFDAAFEPRGLIGELVNR